ncbi:relaxase/mobilization nuclease domain-containing protein [Pedobacter jamesrossensis]|uniref:Relaxase/mobilization nuclease domain-containing protein n=1 Tax=Pedobacter jamesrossensis TaxID=1908238 RepID=A0ABV8NS76_9SPHI
MDIVVKLFTTSIGFPAVQYNMNKVESGDAELMVYKNFGILHAFTNPVSADFEHYLGAVSSLSRKSWYAQFHAVLSVKGKLISSEGLKDFAERWLREMGYASQPYLLFFHSDTKNNHVHIVSTSIMPSGKKISDSFNRIRAIDAVNKLLGIDVKAVFTADVSPLLDYKFSSLAQFSSLLRLKGYTSYTAANQFIVRKYGRTFLKMSEGKIERMIISQAPSEAVIEEIRLAINLALNLKDNTCFPLYQPLAHQFAKRLTGFRSDLSDYLLNHYGLEILYHFKQKAISGFTAIDHKNHLVIQGSQLMELGRLTGENTTGIFRAKSYSR